MIQKKKNVLPIRSRIGAALDVAMRLRVARKVGAAMIILLLWMVLLFLEVDGE